MFGFAVLLAATPLPAYAWGSEGHRIVSAIAADELTSLARAQVQSLLGSSNARPAMEDASTWADEIKFQRPGTRPWHYVDIEIGTRGYDKGADCPTGDCVVAQIERDETILRNKKLASPVRAEALRFLIHFVGDLHQPLHCADNHDRGGNEVKVLIGRRHENLHAVWDVNVVQALGRDPDAVAARLEKQIMPAEIASWRRGAVEDWANETFHVAEREIYAKLSGKGGTEEPVILPLGYAKAESGVTARQLERAGVRLAGVLNSILR
ncbi:MAG: S1/P1 nuclease [Rhizomicrobium sp.]